MFGLQSLTDLLLIRGLRECAGLTPCVLERFGELVRASPKRFASGLLRAKLFRQLRVTISDRAESRSGMLPGQRLDPLKPRIDHTRQALAIVHTTHPTAGRAPGDERE